MCGIAGWNLTERAPLQFYSVIANIMEKRGDHSFGIFDADTNRIMRGLNGITANSTAEEIASVRGFIHTRYATQGERTLENAHPFQIGDLVGAHNGTLADHFIYNAKYNRDCKVDSQHIFYQIIEDKPLDELKGYGAIEYVRDNTLYIGKCNGGELVCARTSLGIVYASTQEAVIGACKQAGIELETFYTVESGKLYKVEKDSLYETDKTFQLGDRWGDNDYDWWDKRYKKHKKHSRGKRGRYDTRTQWERESDAHNNTLGFRKWEYRKCEGCDEYHLCAEIQEVRLCDKCIKLLGLKDEKLLRKIENTTGTVGGATGSTTISTIGNTTGNTTGPKLLTGDILPDESEDAESVYGKCDYCDESDVLTRCEIDEVEELLCGNCVSEIFDEMRNEEKDNEKITSIVLSDKQVITSNGTKASGFVFGPCDFCHTEKLLIVRTDIESKLCESCERRVN